jgi:hypothetical protein
MQGTPTGPIETANRSLRGLYGVNFFVAAMQTRPAALARASLLGEHLAGHRRRRYGGDR